MEQVLPAYLAGLKRLCQLPEEFNHRFWVSCLKALLAELKTEYRKWQAQAQKADFLGKFMTMGVDVVLKAGGMEPVAPPASPQVGISVSPSGIIEPALLNYPLRQPDAIVMTFEKFEEIATRVEEEIMNGMTMLNREKDIPKLIYDLASKRPKT